MPDRAVDTRQTADDTERAREKEMAFIVGELNRRYEDGGLVATLSVGRFLLDLFFEGDPDVFRARSRKHPKFRSLVERGDLEMSYSFLWSAVSVVEQCMVLPDSVAEALPVSHHRVLLSVKDAAAKRRFAEIAVEKCLSKRELERRVRKSWGQPTNRGRPRLPALIKGLRLVRKGVVMAASEEVDAAVVHRTGVQNAELALKDLEQDIASLYRVASTLRQEIRKVKRAG